MIIDLVGLDLGGIMSIKKITALLLAGALMFTALTGCGANAEDTVATLGEEKVSFGVTNFLMQYQKAAVEDMYAAYGMSWDLDMYGNGVTLEEDFKGSAMQLLHDLYTLKNHMDDYGVEITAEDEAAIKEAASAFIAANSADAIEEMGAKQEIVEEVLYLYTIQAKMYEAIIADTNREVSAEEANMRGYSIVTIDLAGKYDESYNYVEYTDAEVAVLKESANRMSELLKEKSLEDAAKEVGFEVTTDAYGKNDTALNKDILTALDGLKEGEVSNMIETESALYFVRIDKDTDETATEANRQSIIAQREAALYEKVLEDWQAEDGWTVDEAMVDKVDFHNILTQVKESAENTESE